MVNVRPIIEVAQEAARPEIHQVNGLHLTTKKMHVVEPDPPVHLNVETLAGVIEYVKRNPDKAEDLQVQVRDFRTVFVHGVIQGRYTRTALLSAHIERSIPTDVQNADRETAIVYAMKNFLPGNGSIEDDFKRLICLLSSISTEQVIEESDEGATQHIATKSGVKTKFEAVQNPFNLSIPLTFADIEQPKIPMFLRMAPVSGGVRVSFYFAQRNDWKQKLVDAITAKLRSEIDVPIIG